MGKLNGAEAEGYNAQSSWSGVWGYQSKRTHDTGGREFWIGYLTIQSVLKPKESITHQ